MNSLVSVIIPVHNSEEYLLETIQSVEKQDHKEVEIIIVNNCSTKPSTIEALNKLRANYKIVDSENKGLPNARNDGIKVAKGFFILPLDSDDIIESSFLSECISMFGENTEHKVVRTFVKLFGAKKGIIEFDEFSYAKLLARNLMVATSMFKKEDWERVHGYNSDLKTGFEDWEFWISLLKDGGRVGTIRKPLFHYRIQRNSMMRSLKMSQLREARRTIWEKHKDAYSKHFMDPVESFEYQYLTDSKAHKLGSLLLAPFAKFKLMK